MFQFNASKFKQKLPAIILLSATQLLLSLTFPSYKSLGRFACYTINLIVGFLSIYIYILAFSSADKFKFYIDFDGFDDLLNAQFYAKRAKLITKLTLLSIAIVSMHFLWRNDYYCMPSLHYAFLYSHIAISFSLFYRAAHRKAD